MDAILDQNMERTEVSQNDEEIGTTARMQMVPVKDLSIYSGFLSTGEAARAISAAVRDAGINAAAPAVNQSPWQGHRQKDRTRTATGSLRKGAFRFPGALQRLVAADAIAETQR